MTSRRRLSVAAKILAAVVIIAAASGRLPHLVLTQAVISTLLALVVAPLWLLGRPESGPGSRAWIRVPPFLAVGTIAAGTIAIQLPPVVGLISDGGVPAVLALGALLGGALCFWSVVVAPARVSGLAASGYVVIGGVPISIPAMILILSPRDIYATFHAAAPPSIGALNDQVFAGFVLFAGVKIAIWTIASIAFFAAARESAGPDDDDGSPQVPAPPTVPGWVLELATEAPTADEPAPSPGREREAAGTR